MKASSRRLRGEGKIKVVMQWVGLGASLHHDDEASESLASATHKEEWKRKVGQEIGLMRRVLDPQPWL
jgi:hypothetical protein